MPAEFTQVLMDILPFIIFAGGGTLIFMAGVFWRRPAFLFSLSLITAGLSGLAALFPTPGGSAFQGMIDSGTYGRFFIVLISSISLITLLFMQQYVCDRNMAGDEVYGLVPFAALGMALTACATNWLVFFLGLELLSISLYILIAINKRQSISSEAGLKYFIVGSVAGAFLTFGIAVLYSAAGTLFIEETLFHAAFTEFGPTLLGLSLILVGIAFKLSIVPFHLWTPDVYQGAPAPVSAFLSTGSKIAVFAALVRFSSYMSLPVWDYCVPVLWVLSAATMLVGSITALSQSFLKRLLAYSSIAQMGYLLAALLAAKHAALPSILFYLSVYAVMDLGAFGIIGTLSGKKDRDDLSDYRGLGYSHPWQSAVLALCLISLAGLPPTAGFTGKFILLTAILKADYLVASAVVLAVIISIFFYLRVLAVLYTRPADDIIRKSVFKTSGRLACLLIVMLILILGLFPGPLWSIISRTYPASVFLK